MYLFDTTGFDTLARELLSSANPAHRTHKTDEGVGYEFDMPGVGIDNIDISTNNGLMSVTGKANGRNFSYALTLPHTVDLASAKAVYENGVLRVLLPWSEMAKPKKIEIVAADRTQELESADSS